MTAPAVDVASPDGIDVSIRCLPRGTGVFVGVLTIRRATDRRCLYTWSSALSTRTGAERLAKDQAAYVLRIRDDGVRA